MLCFVQVVGEQAAVGPKKHNEWEIIPVTGAVTIMAVEEETTEEMETEIEEEENIRGMETTAEVVIRSEGIKTKKEVCPDTD